MSYRELNERANQLAHYLKEQGVGPEVVVGVSQERSVDLIVSLLGVLKAGGAYLPLDPEYPESRREYMAAQAGAKLVLTVLPEDLHDTKHQQPGAAERRRQSRIRDVHVRLDRPPKRRLRDAGKRAAAGV